MNEKIQRAKGLRTYIKRTFINSYYWRRCNVNRRPISGVGLCDGHTCKRCDVTAHGGNLRNWKSMKWWWGGIFFILHQRSFCIPYNLYCIYANVNWNTLSCFPGVSIHGRCATIVFNARLEATYGRFVFIM